MNRKCLFALILGLAFLICCQLALGEPVDSGFCGSNATWELDDQGRLIVSGSGTISTEAFRDDLRIVSVEINDGITEIENFAFIRCRNLESLKLPATLKKFAKVI